MSNDFYEERLVKARKNHVCCQCKDVIVRGEKYYVHTGHNEDHWWREKSHETCHKFFLDLIRDNDISIPIDSIEFGDLSYLIEDFSVSFLEAARFNSNKENNRREMFEQAYVLYQLEKL